MMIRAYAEEDYAVIESWWGAHGLSSIPREFLPAGFIASSEGKDIFAGWIHMDKYSAMSWMNWFVSNPEATGKEKAAGFSAITERLKQFAYSEGYRFSALFLYQRSMQNLAKKEGFIINHQKVSEMFCLLKGEEKVA